MSNHNLFIHGANGASEPATTEQILAAARQVLAHRVRRGASLNSPQKVREYLTVRLGHLDHEVFGVILADQRHRVIEYVELFRGTIDGASVYPREIVKLAIEKGAAACVLLHNHPSGVKDQSQADELITKRVAAALALIDVRVLDHLIFAGDSVFSFAEMGSYEPRPHTSPPAFGSAVFCGMQHFFDPSGKSTAYNSITAAIAPDPWP
jgi:DNA repair protein RadC